MHKITKLKQIFETDQKELFLYRTSKFFFKKKKFYLQTLSAILK